MIDFKMNPYHFFDSKLLEFKSDFVANSNWQEKLEKRKKSFADYSFIVTDNEIVLYSDFVIAWGFNDDGMHINFDSSTPKKIYWINIHLGTKEIFINSEEAIDLIHENIVITTIKNILHLKFKEHTNYTNIIENNSTGIFHQYLAFKHYKQDSCFFLQNENQSRNKVNQKHYLLKEKCKVDVLVLNKVQKSQLRDDFIEFEHLSPYTQSEIKYFSINGGKAVSQVNSIIHTDSISSETHQHIKHILINDKAQSFSKPNLMILNPEVIASHGNSIGSYNDDEIFYLMQRGMPLELAKSIIQNGIISQALEIHPDYELIKGFYE